MVAVGIVANPASGTNNAFPELREATVAGLAAGLVATGTVDTSLATSRATALEVTNGEHSELALVDVGVPTARYVGSRALWHPDALTELYAVAGGRSPLRRRHGRHVAGRQRRSVPAQRFSRSMRRCSSRKDGQR